MILEIKNRRTIMFDNYPDLMSSSQAAELLKIGKNKLYEILQNKTIPCLRIGKKYLIPKKLLIEYIMSTAAEKVVVA